MRRCLETDCRVVLKLSAMAFGVIACNAIKAMIARLVGSAIAWKMSRLILCKFSFSQPTGCKYMCNYSVSQIFFRIEGKSVGIVSLEGRHKIPGYVIDFYLKIRDKVF